MAKRLELLTDGIQSDNVMFRPMTRQETETFMSCTLQEMAGRKHCDVTTLCDKFKNNDIFAVRMALKRLEVFAPNLKMTDNLFLFILSLCENPAQISLWIHTLFHLGLKHDNKLDLNVLATNYIPWGIPTEENYSKRWDAQKDNKGHNRVDSREAYFNKDL
jgi:hypothetical protein